MDKLVLAIFTDGTANDAIAATATGAQTNVAKLFTLWDTHPSEGVVRAKHYVVGVGTGSGLDTIFGGFSGQGFQSRIDNAMRWIWEMSQQYPKIDIEVQLFGFSRGAAESLHLINVLNDPNDLGHYQLSKRKLKVVFAGLFDPVASLGFPGNGIDPGARLKICPSKVDTVVSLVAQTEVRAFFNLQSIRVPPPNTNGALSVKDGDWAGLWKNCPLPSTKWTELLMPGVHSDVGGGYEIEEWIPDVLAEEPRSGEALTNYVYRMKDLELSLGAAPRGGAGNDFWTRDQVQARVNFIYSQRMQEFNRKRLEDAAGNHQVTMSDADRTAPTCPNLRVRDNSLSRISLWTMIRLAEKAGIKWMTIGELQPDQQAQIQRLPRDHALYFLQALDLFPNDLGNSIQLQNEHFWREAIPYFHDSRLTVDLGQRNREVYFCGRNG